MLFEVFAYIVYIRERYCFYVVCTFKEAIKNVGVKVDLQKGAPRFRGKIDNRFVSFIQFIFSFIVVKW